MSVMEQLAKQLHKIMSCWWGRHDINEMGQLEKILYALYDQENIEVFGWYDLQNTLVKGYLLLFSIKSGTDKGCYLFFNLYYDEFVLVRISQNALEKLIAAGNKTDRNRLDTILLVNDHTDYIKAHLQHKNPCDQEIVVLGDYSIETHGGLVLFGAKHGLRTDYYLSISLQYSDPILIPIDEGDMDQLTDIQKQAKYDYQEQMKAFESDFWV